MLHYVTNDDTSRLLGRLSDAVTGALVVAALVGLINGAVGWGGALAVAAVLVQVLRPDQG